MTVIENGRSGYLETNVEKLLAHMQRLTENRDEALELGKAAKDIAEERFSIKRFAHDWLGTLQEVAGDSVPRRSTPGIAHQSSLAAR